MQIFGVDFFGFFRFFRQPEKHNRGRSVTPSPKIFLDQCPLASMVTDGTQNPAVEAIWRDRPAGRFAVEVPEIDPILAQLPREVSRPTVDHRWEADVALRATHEDGAE